MTRGSYLLIEPGMTVQAVDGSMLGAVTELVADESVDIFRGIVVDLQSGRTHQGVVFMPGEHVTAVDGQIVSTDMTRESAAQLDRVSSDAASAEERIDATPTT